MWYQRIHSFDSSTSCMISSIQHDIPASELLYAVPPLLSHRPSDPPGWGLPTELGGHFAEPTAPGRPGLNEAVVVDGLGCRPTSDASGVLFCFNVVVFFFLLLLSFFSTVRFSTVRGVSFFGCFFRSPGGFFGGVRLFFLGGNRGPKHEGDVKHLKQAAA